MWVFEWVFGWYKASDSAVVISNPGARSKSSMHIPQARSMTDVPQGAGKVKVAHCRSRRQA